ncbi:hypothetical protein GLAREA_06384 [Glarea lozoyensis ATCC 20868]|uniref:MARVEL domain-containing protein n=1 Tax=Glarea lozoyensis (strain ATCC 20868 / MF5171) TaxID=1116229 RepID=S3DMQ8_GLAL2|nr:uncharacterized protein GLAREA_06384 [Glarea lozoyensis ATCC 20868]EPE33371.1 hypothetical protein GLAREA_06384 [Glarea lozoyensis ATCC 20868]
MWYNKVSSCFVLVVMRVVQASVCITIIGLTGACIARIPETETATPRFLITIEWSACVTLVVVLGFLIPPSRAYLKAQVYMEALADILWTTMWMIHCVFLLNFIDTPDCIETRSAIDSTCLILKVNLGFCLLLGLSLFGSIILVFYVVYRRKYPHSNTNPDEQRWYNFRN